MFKHFIKSFLGILFFFIIMFIAAGKINYFEGWTYFAISMFGLAINILSAKHNHELISERSRHVSHTQSWDKKILGFSTILTILSYGIAGLDSGRFNWSSPFGFQITIIGILLMVTGQIIFTVAKYQNNFFSSVVRIQKGLRQDMGNEFTTGHR